MCWHVTVRLWCGIIKNFFSERDVPSTKKPLKENRCLNVFFWQGESHYIFDFAEKQTCIDPYCPYMIVCPA